MSGSICFRCAMRRACVPRKIPTTRGFQSTSITRQTDKKSQSIAQSSSSPSKKPHQKSHPEIKPYTDEEKARLSKFYTPAQMAAIEAGESAVDPEDLLEQGALREDSFALPYGSDDLSQLVPTIDRPEMAPDENMDPKIRLKTREEIATDLADWLINVPEDSTQVDLQSFMDNMRLTVGKEEAERNPPTYLAPQLPKNIPALRAAVQPSNLGNEDASPQTQLLMQQTGLKLADIRSLRVKRLVQHRVVNQTRMGKIQSQYALVVAGNSKGLLGIGEGKSSEADEARKQAVFNAIRGLKPIPRYEERTIYGDLAIKIGAVELELMTRPPGFGIRCQHLIYEMCRCAGIHDLAARVTRSRNPMNVVKATYQALLNQRLPDEVARGLGRKLVDVRKVYYSGNV